MPKKQAKKQEEAKTRDKKPDFFTEMFLEWKNILLSPNKTLSGFKAHKLLASTFYIFTAGFITALIFKIISYFMGQSAPGVILFTPIFVVAFMYLVASFIWALGKLFGAKIKWAGWTAQFFAAWSPIGALSGIQFIGWIAQIYGLYIIFLSVKNFMRLSTAKSIIINVIYVIALFLLSLILYLPQIKPF